MEHKRHHRSGHVSAGDVQRMARSVSGRSRFAYWGMFERVFDSANVRWRLVPRWKRIWTVLFGSIAALWIFAAVGLWCGYKFVKKYDEVSFVKIALLPFFLDEHRRDMGEYNIREAFKAMGEHDANSAYRNFTMGVIRSPDNLEGRLALAQIHMFWIHDIDYAGSLLDARIKLAYEKKDLKYLKFAQLVFMASSEHFDKFTQLSNKMLADNLTTDSEILSIAKPILKQKLSLSDFDDIVRICKGSMKAFQSPTLKKFFASNCASALSGLGDISSALAVLTDVGLEKSPAGMLIKSRVSWESGRELEAISLARKTAKISKKSQNAYALLAQYYRELGLTDLAENAEDTNALIADNLYSAKLLSIRRADSEAARAKGIDEFMATFSTSDEAVSALLSYAISTSDEATIKRCIARKSNNPNFAIFGRMAYAEFLLKQKMIDAAAEELLTIKVGKNNKLANLHKGLSLALEAISGKNIYSQIDIFVGENKQNVNANINLMKFFYRIGLLNECELICELLKADNPNDVRISAMLARIYSDRSDMSSLARLCADHIVPINLLLQVKPFLYSDASVFLTPTEREKLNAKIIHVEDVLKRAPSVM